MSDTSERRRIAILGATGSVGESTLDVISRHPDRFAVGALTAHGQWQKLAQLCRVHRPEIAVLANPAAALELERALADDGTRTRVLAGEAGLIEAATSSGIDTVVAAIVGAAGLRSTVAAARAGKRILLANKEALVIGGAVFMRRVEAGGATLLPIDSEHNAIFQCLPQSYARKPAAAGRAPHPADCIRRPLRTRPLAELPSVTADEACAHPNWAMGRKISVDSATMMNKGLEMIEAHWLFGVPRERIEIVVHPESVVHSLVEYVDGSVLAQARPSGHADADRAGARVSGSRRRRCRRVGSRAPRHAQFLGARPRAVPVPRVGRGCAGCRRYRTRYPQRRQRGRGRGIPRFANPLHRHCAGLRGSACPLAGTTCRHDRRCDRRRIPKPRTIARSWLKLSEAA
jgi:1-deoxy-D-xylulose 5-phosphate reductoisomerase